MKKRISHCLLPIAYCLFLTLPFKSFAQKNYTSLVNPFIGTGGHGHTYPGASMPFGMMQLSPDTRMADWDGSSGYHFSDSVIYGFSHTHLSGTGIPDYCDVLMMPFTGESVWDKNDYRSPFSHQNEKASPGYYEVLLDKHQVKAQLTTSVRSGMHQYTFPQSGGNGKLLIDLTHRDQLLDVYLEKIDQYELRGYRRSKSWAQDQTLYFHIKSEQPFYTEEWKDSINGKEAVTKMVLSFIIPIDKKARFKVGISGVSMEGAKLNLDTEIPGWDFDNMKNAAGDAWNKELSKIEIKGGTRDQQTVFYTALYHTFLSPNIYQDVDGKYRGTDLQVHTAEKDFVNYTVFSLWDTYRAYHPLMTIINRDRTLDWIKTFQKQYEHGGMLPVWELSGNETFCMIGYHSVPVITDAWQKGIRNFDSVKALRAMRSYAESDRFGLAHYRKHGYLSNDNEHESVSKTLEYAYDDWCIAQFAKMNREDSVFKNYIQRAQYYKNVFDPATKHMRGKVQGSWYQPFDPREINNFYTEGNSWQYSFALPHDIETLISLHGGKKLFTSKLNELFTTSSKTTGRDQADVTGLIGQYAHGNEPSHHMAYLFNYVGMPWRTQELVHKICSEFYTNEPGGLIGNEDCGQMSAWYIFSAMGFYPVNPANSEYVIGTPVFDEIRINLENGNVFTIHAKRPAQSSKYIQVIKFDGKIHTTSFIHHDAIMKGGIMEFNLEDQPNLEWATQKKDYPNSVINENLITPVPFFDNRTNKFKNQTRIVLQHLNSETKIFYRIVQPGQPRFVRYEKPFTIKESCIIESYAMNSEEKSRIVSQQFYKIPNDFSVRVLSNVHPMYTGGGPDALVDGIKGNTNWKTGEWQSYFGQDFEAIVDLGKTRLVNYTGVHVLQDVSPWILFPGEVVFYTSLDGKIFKQAGRVINKAEKSISNVETQELGMKLGVKTRFIKVKVTNGGKLPSWHESAGNPSHLFIDEIIVK